MSNDNVIKAAFGKVSEDKIQHEYNRRITTPVSFADKQEERRIIKEHVEPLFKRDLNLWPDGETSLLTDYDVRVLTLVGYSSLVQIFSSDNWMMNLTNELAFKGYDPVDIMNRLIPTYIEAEFQMDVASQTGDEVVIRKTRNIYQLKNGHEILIEYTTDSLEGISSMILAAGCYFKGLNDGSKVR